MPHQPLTRRALLAGIGVAVGGVLLRAVLPANAAEAYTVQHSDSEWLRLLGPERYQILRQNGTEPAESSPLLNEHRDGSYACAGCSQWLFSSKDKYDSGDGWPSFTRPLSSRVVRTRSDYELIEERTEVHCSRCGGHLGHIFDDGPAPAHLRYCIDGLALHFAPGVTASGR